MLRLSLVLKIAFVVLAMALRPADAATLTATGFNFGVTGGNTEATTYVVDADDNLYMAGYYAAASVTVGNDTSNNPVTLNNTGGGFLVKYNSDRKVVWAQAITTATSVSTSTSRSIYLDGASPPNVYLGGAINMASITVAGQTLTKTGSTDGYLAKVDGSTGSGLWIRGIGGTGTVVAVTGVAASSTGGAVYATGTFTSADITFPATIARTGTSTNSFVVKLDSGGNYVGSQGFGGTGTTSMQFEAAAVDASNNFYAVGRLSVGNLTNPVAITRKGTQDGVVVKYDSNFSRLWLVNYGSSGATIRPQAVAADSSGVYFGGPQSSNVTLGTLPTNTKIGTTDGIVVKASPQTGEPIWATNMGGAGSTMAEMIHLALDSAGSVYSGFAFNTANFTTPALAVRGTLDNVAIVTLSSSGLIIDSGSFGGAGARFSVWYGQGVPANGAFTIAGAMQSGSFTNPALTRSGTNHNVVALTMQPVYSATVTTAGTGGGSVNSSPEGLSCGSGTCQIGLARGTQLTLTARPSTNALFTGWSGTCSGTNTTTTVTVGVATHCIANFYSNPITETPPWFGTNGSGELNFNALTATVDTAGRVSVALPEGNFNDTGLTFTVSLDDGSPLPPWLSFDSATRSFIGTVPSSIADVPASTDRSVRDATSATGRPLAVPPTVVASRITVLITVTDTRGRRAQTTFPLIIYGQRTRSEVVAVSVTDRGVAATGASAVPALSDDGQVAVFQTSSTNLFPADVNSTGPDVIRYDIAGGVLERFSTKTFMGTIAGGARGWSGNSAISADARYIAFASEASDIGLPWNSGPRQVWISDASVGRTTAVTPSPVAVSAATDGTLADGASDHPSISQDGRYVAFDSMAGNLVAGTNAGTRRVYRKDRTTGAVVLVSAHASGASFSGTSENPSISADGRYVAFESSTSGVVQVYRKDLTSGAVTLVSATAASVAGTGPSSRARISRDGRYIAFQAASFQGPSSNLTGVAATQVMRKDMNSGALLVVSATASATPADATASSPTMSGDGRFVAFVTAATNLGVATGGIAQIVVRDTVAGTLALASTTTANTAANGASSEPAISGDGRYIAFASAATNLATGMTAGQLYLAGNPLQVPLATGWWWNPSEPGRGYAIEVSGDQMKLGVFAYAEDGTPIWYTGTGTVSATSWSGSLQLLANGPTLSTAYQAPVVSGSVAASMTVATQSRATLNMLGAIPLQRFDFVPSGVATGPQLGSPESGWWWTQDEGGTGWFLEVQGSSLFIGGMYYDSRGQASWVSSAGAMASAKAYTGRVTTCGGGQTLGGVHRAPTCSEDAPSIALSFTSPVSATLTLPSGRQIALQRFRF